MVKVWRATQEVRSSSLTFLYINNIHISIFVYHIYINYDNGGNSAYDSYKANDNYDKYSSGHSSNACIGSIDRKLSYDVFFFT